jgi:hypothetical protein
MLPEREVQFAPTVHHVHRRPLGLSPSPLLAGLGVVIFVIALILFALGSWLAGIVFLVLAGVTVCLLLVAISREPEAHTSRLATTAADRADGFGRLTAVAVRAGVPAGLELARLWGRRRRLRFELRRQLGPLGEAVHLGHREQAMQIKARADELDRSLRETDRRAAETTAGVRQRIERHRATSHRTERLAVAGEASVSARDDRVSG